MTADLKTLSEFDDRTLDPPLLEEFKHEVDDLRSNLRQILDFVRFECDTSKGLHSQFPTMTDLRSFVELQTHFLLESTAFQSRFGDLIPPEMNRPVDSFDEYSQQRMAYYFCGKKKK